jgi:hypothetical protein
MTQYCPLSQYCPLLEPPNQTSQEVTHSEITLAEARLTAEFWWVHGHHGFKTRCVINGAFIHISTSPFLGDVRRHNHPLLGPSVPACDPHEITPFLVSQRVPAGIPHRLVHAPTISGWTMVLIPFVMTHPPMTQYCPLLAPPNQTYQEVTHPMITLA